MAVIYQNGGSVQNTLYVCDAPNNTNRINCHPSFGDTIYFDYGNISSGGRISVAQPGGWDDVWHLLELHRDGGDGDIYDNTSNILSDTFTDDLDATQSATMYLGITAAFSAEFQGYFADIYIFNDALSAGELTNMRTFINNKWAVY